MRSLIYQILALFAVVSCLTACVPVGGNSGTNNSNSSTNTSGTLNGNGIYQDQIFSEDVRHVKIVQQDEQLYDAVIPISQSVPTVLTFDWLELGDREVYGELIAKVIHCNADWQKSKLYNMDFLYDYNEFPLTGEELSYNTKVPFARYALPLPKVKISGNYVMAVYERNNQNDPLLTKRFMVYEPRVSINASVTLSSGIKERDTHHQLNFLINYQSFDIPNPYNDVYVVMRQNQQWFNTISGLKPSFVREDMKELEYTFFDLKNNFWAGNEYRYFDLRTSKALGQNVAEIQQDKFPMEAYLLPDRSRAHEAYSQYNDLNGGYIVGNLETGGGELNADYLNTHFFLDASEPVQGNIYVVGDFNDRILDDNVKMQYDSVQQGYTLDILLKQGFYNYLFYVDNGKNMSPYPFDGSHYETENIYEIFVYTRPLGARSDLLIGYSNIVSNLR